MLTQFGPYLIDEELAQGGMARVFRARLRGLGGFEKTLVLKQIRPELSKDPRFVELFVREANTLVQLVHPHIVPVYELGAVEGTYYLSMEYIEGATLAEILRNVALATALVAQIGVQVADALDYAHSRFGILHRDVTPRNLIVDDAGHVRLLDFGIAAALGVESESFGSPGYMSPEQVERRALTPASDLFSLGVVLTEALLGFAPFEKVTRGTLAQKPELARDPSLPPALSGLLDRMLAALPEDRPQSAAEVSRGLRAWLAQAHPEGVFEALRKRAQAARAGRKQEPASTALGAPTKPVGSAQGAPVRTIAASPVLTEMLRSASGVALSPLAHPQDGPATRPISRHPPQLPSSTPEESIPLNSPREAEVETSSTKLPDRRTNARATAWMMRAWPPLALLAMAVLLLMMWSRPARPRDAGVVPDQTRAREAASNGSSAAPSSQTPPQQTSPRRLDSPSRPPLGPLPAAPVDADVPLKALAEKAPSEASAEAEGRALLTMSALPWAEVTLDGQVLGTTPLRDQRIRPGVHALVFACPPLGKTERFSVEVARDARARVTVDFSVEPTKRSLDGVREAR